MKKQILISGGTGFLGKKLTDSLVKKNHRVIVLTRSEKVIQNYIKNENKYPENLEYRHWDDLIETRQDLNIDACINVAGERVIDHEWTVEFKKKLYGSRIDTTKKLYDFLKDNKTSTGKKPKLIMTSAVGYYPSNDFEKVYDESYITKPYNEITEFTNAIEKLEEDKKFEIDRAIIRCGIILGNDDGTYQKLLIPALFGIFANPGGGKQPFPWIHIDDAVNLYIHTLENDNLTGPINGVAPQLIRFDDFNKSFAKSLKRPQIRIPIPSFVFKTIFGPVRSKLLLEGQFVEPKVAKETNFQYKYPTIDSCLENLSSNVQFIKEFQKLLK